MRYRTKHNWCHPRTSIMFPAPLSFSSGHSSLLSLFRTWARTVTPTPASISCRRSFASARTRNTAPNHTSISRWRSFASALSRTHDHLGRPTGFSLGSDYAVEYGYDTYGRFGSITSHWPLATSHYQYSYLPGTDLLAGYTAGDFTRTVSYEPYRSLITSVENKHGSTTISRYDYENDALGRRTAISRSGTAFGDKPVRDSYGYNHRSEVTSARRTLAGNPSQEVRGFSYDYAYDPIGNRISSTEYDPDNNALTASQSSPRYTGSRA